jgi:magnesium-transporting ATPase (P-type)
MTKHILAQSVWQCIILFVFLFAGEYMIPESVPKYMNPSKPGFVMAGRADDWNGKPLYTREMMEHEGASRHYTWIFTTFVLMQISNMFCSRKVHDEWNIFEGLHKNFVFIGIWIFILGAQILITTFGSRVFVVSPDGLDGKQWALAFGVGLTTFVIDAICKVIPDWMCPKLGQDSVDDERAKN